MTYYSIVYDLLQYCIRPITVLYMTYYSIVYDLLQYCIWPITTLYTTYYSIVCVHYVYSYSYGSGVVCSKHLFI